MFSIILPTLLIGAEKKIRIDLLNGEKVFSVSGCASCHSKEKKPADLNSLKLGGGVKIETAFGRFYAPNISSDKVFGIGSWTFEEFKAALKEGVSPTGQNYFPAFPYNAYKLMSDEDMLDLFYFMRTLPPSEEPNIKHDILYAGFLRKFMPLYNARYSFLNTKKQTDLGEGEYMVRALGHCSECHTSRDVFGVPKFRSYLSGGVIYEGGVVKTPNITPDKSGIGDWSNDEIVNYLRTGFTPDFDSSGGLMAEVIDNLQPLNDEELKEIAQYLKSIDPIATKKSD